MISFAVMAHPSRVELVTALERRLFDPEVVWDRERGEWDTGRRALLAFDPAADWHAVIQDDAVVPDAFLDALTRALAHVSDQPVGLYLGRVRPRVRLVQKVVDAALASGASWVEMGGPWWGVGVVFPTALIPEIVERGDDMRHPHYDYRLARATKESGRWCRYPVPSLVDHDPTRPSLLDHAGGDRRAHVFIGDRSPAEIDWSLEPVRVDHRGRVLTTPAAV